LNIAAKDYEFDRLPDAFAAAEAADFKLFYSFDMTYDWNDADIIEVIKSHVDSPATFKWNDAVLVSTYFGGNKGNDFWNNIKTQLSGQGVEISLAPAFTEYTDAAQAQELASTFPAIDGFFNW
jgi:glucan endo-1,3-alpha-glucosidase